MIVFTSTRNNPSPCLDCKDRTLNCHSECGKYHVFKNKVDSVNAIYTANKRKQANMDHYVIEKIFGR